MTANQRGSITDREKLARARFLVFRDAVLIAFGMEPASVPESVWESDTSAELLEEVLALLLAQTLQAAAEDRTPRGMTPTQMRAALPRGPDSIKKALDVLKHAGVHVRDMVSGQLVKLDPTKIPSREERNQVVERLEDLLDILPPPYDDATRDLHRKFQFIRRALDGSLTVLDVEEFAPGILDTYVTALARSPPDGNDYRRWTEADFANPCGVPSSKGVCGLPKGHAMDHHRLEGRVHYVELASGTAIPLPVHLVSYSIQTRRDAEVAIEAFLHPASRTKLERFLDVRLDERRRLRDFIDLSLHQGWLPEGAVSPRLRSLRRDLDDLSRRAASRR